MIPDAFIELQELVNSLQNNGVDNDEIVSALETIVMTLKEEAEDE